MGTVFLSSFANPQDNTPVYVSLNGGSENTIYAATAFAMPGSCTFNSIYITGTAAFAGFVAPNTLTYTLYKNGSPTAITFTLSAPTTLGATVSANSTFSLGVVAGDTLAIFFTQTNGANSGVESLVSLRCQ